MPSEAASRRAAALSPIARIADGGGPTQRIPAASTRSANVGVLGEEPEAGMEGVGTGGQRCRHDGRGIEQVEAVRAVRDRDDRPDPEPIAGAGDPSGDLAAVGDEDRSDRGRELGRLGQCSACVADERVNCVRSDTPSPTDAARG